MDRKTIDRLDFTKRGQPEPTTDMRELLTGWLDHQRHEFKRKLRDLGPEGRFASLGELIR